MGILHEYSHIMIVIRFKDMIRRMEEALSDGKLLMFYNRDVNLLDGYNGREVSAYLKQMIRRDDYTPLTGSVSQTTFTSYYRE